ncbi:tryptophan synthase subunit alpha [Streptomyces sp. B8F3]|uniref:tryptophan synthase subunit alpha n=1 Tax=Streptomyces sp. B8F3 TaxID=3153573 RepID=UPI00325E2183
MSAPSDHLTRRPPPRPSDDPFFPGRTPRNPGLALFLNAGDPGLERTRDLLLLFDGLGVDCVELAVPSPESATDGPVVRASAQRALAAGTGVAEVMDLLERVRPRLRHTKVALLADWRHSVRPLGVEPFLRRSRSAGADAVLLHGLPPRATAAYWEAAEQTGQRVVTTCYANSPGDVLLRAARRSTAYVYFVARYGRSGTAAPPAPARLRPAVRALRRTTDVPVAVGFGVRTRHDVRAVGSLGAQAAIVGSALVGRIAQAHQQGGDLVRDIEQFVTGLRPAAGRRPEEGDTAKGAAT